MSIHLHLHIKDFLCFFHGLREKKNLCNLCNLWFKKFLCVLCISPVILFTTAYSENSTTSYFNFLSLPTAPLIQQQQPPPIEKTEIPAIIDFPGGRLIGSVEPVESVSQPSAIRITAPAAFILKRNNLTTNNQQLTTGSVNPVNPVKSLLRFTIVSSTFNTTSGVTPQPSTVQTQNFASLPTINHQPSAILQRYPKIGYVEAPSGLAFQSATRLTLVPGDNIEIELVAQQNIVYFQIPVGEILEITNIEFLENVQLTTNCNCKQVEEMDLSLLYDAFKH